MIIFGSTISITPKVNSRFVISVQVSLRIYFTCSLPGFDDKEERVYQYSLPTDDQKIDFKPNNLYNINIAIYGPQKIEVNSNIDSWLFGGDISIGGE